ncbi:MAG: glutathione S-transferase [Enterobacterales bacterium]|jgi:glutathione S-transferase
MQKLHWSYRFLTSSNPYLLYSFRRCPYAMRARMALAYSNVDIHIEDILLKDKPQSMLDASPKGTVPVLIIYDQSGDDKSGNNNRVIDESIEIMFWALSKADPENWYFGLTDEQQQMTIQLVDEFDNNFKPLLDKYKYAPRFPELSETQYRDKALSYLEKLNLLLVESQYLISEQLSLADIAIFPFIRQFAFVNKPWFDAAPYPKLQQWLKQHLESVLFQSIMEKPK